MKFKSYILFVGLVWSSNVFSQKVGAIQNKAFSVIDMKCNWCHRKEYPKQVFAINNMNASAKKIYKQVFVKEKMPKDSVKLTLEEKEILLKWINEQNQ